jgi:exopolysaccharide biosynthesis predicted pyruvyltransferase EpsI
VLDRATAIRTNRLHVGIGAALLGKQVELSDNSYGKIKAVYAASLSCFPRVSFTDSPTKIEITRQPVGSGVSQTMGAD